MLRVFLRLDLVQISVNLTGLSYIGFPIVQLSSGLGILAACVEQRPGVLAGPPSSCLPAAGYFPGQPVEVVWCERAGV